MRHRHRETEPDGDGAALPEEVAVVVRPGELSGVFSAPRWLRDLGLLTWLLVGIGAVLIGTVWLLGQISSIVVPVTLGAVVASVAAPLVRILHGRGVPRAAGAVIVLLGLVAIGGIIFLLVVGGLASQSDEINAALTKATDKIQGWLEDAGIGSGDAAMATGDVKSAVPDIGGVLLKGAAEGISGLTSIFFTISFAVFSTFFLLKDGPAMRRWIEGHLGIPEAVGRVITGETLRALRQYFLGVTIVAAFNAVVIGAGALILGVPLAGTIAVVTLVGAYVPFIGAWVAGAFAVLLALAGAGEPEAIIMTVIVLMGNGMLQQVVQPIAFGATLSLNPLVVLIVTISGGSLFGMIGLVLAAPLTSAAVHISRDLAGARAEREPDAEGEPEAGAARVAQAGTAAAKTSAAT
jgi:predicted PurR-regulated permease PerM